jgi:hypothetical protein
VVRRLVTVLWSGSPRKNHFLMIPTITTDYCRTLWVKPRSISSTKTERHFNWVKISNIVLNRLLRFYRQWFNKKETFPGWIDFKSFFCSNFMAQILNTWYFFFFSILKEQFEKNKTVTSSTYFCMTFFIIWSDNFCIAQNHPWSFKDTLSFNNMLTYMLITNKYIKLNNNGKLK